MQGGRVLLNFSVLRGEFELRNYEGEMLLFCKTTTRTTDLSAQALISWGLSETSGSQYIFIIAEEDLRTFSKLGSVGPLRLVNIVDNYLKEAPRCGIKNPDQALGTSQIEIGRCNPAGIPLELHFIMVANDSPSNSGSTDPPDSPLFTMRSPRTEHLELDGVVVDDEMGDEVDVTGEGGENPTELIFQDISIKERMSDGTHKKLAEMNLMFCIGYCSFAQKLVRLYPGNQQLDDIEHVLWPWPGYSTTYMAQDDIEMDPRAIPWITFFKKLKYILVRSVDMSDTNMLPITFCKGKVDNKYKIPREFITKFKWLLTTVHILWSSWKNREPLDPDMITDGNVARGVSSVHYFDTDGAELDIPNILSVLPFERYLSDYGDDSQDEIEEEDDDENDNGDAEVIDNDREESNEEDGENGSEDNGDKGSEVDEDDCVKDFMQNLASIVVRECE